MLTLVLQDMPLGAALSVGGNTYNLEPYEEGQMPASQGTSFAMGGAAVPWSAYGGASQFGTRTTLAQKLARAGQKHQKLASNTLQMLANPLSLDKTLIRRNAIAFNDRLSQLNEAMKDAKISLQQRGHMVDCSMVDPKNQELCQQFIQRAMQRGELPWATAGS